MKRPSLALCCILKNEVKNLPRLLASIKDCFDEIHLTDTGSTDGTVELIRQYESGENPAHANIHLHHFDWCDDFSAARAASFSHAKTDYVMWLDLDDVLSNREAFIGWRDEAMGMADFWLATYHYALNPEGKPLCSFARERITKRSLGFQWRYFVHEGMLPLSPHKKDVMVQYAVTWSVNHLRDSEDMKADKSRNLRLFEKNAGKLDSRMRYYYGKELFENQKPLEAFSELMNAVAEPDLEIHDRIMGLQYACLCAMQMNQFERAIQLAHQGLQLAPQRAEFFVAIGDSLLKLNRIQDAEPFFHAASHCQRTANVNPIQGAIFSHEESYGHYPLNQIARIKANLSDIEGAQEYTTKALKLGPNAETMGIHQELEKIKEKAGIGKKSLRQETSDIVISCAPQGFYEWDDEVYRKRGIGGSETAAVEMANWLAMLSGRKVLVFNDRKEAKQFDGVDYLPSSELPIFLSRNKPAVHIAWRHVMKVSDDPMYVWCHDLLAPGLEHKNAYHRVLALSPFHKRFLKHFVGVPDEKIIVTRNGIEPRRFFGHKEKEFGKVVFSSSPDRGLDRAIKVMERVVKHVPEAKLHVYYGFDNIRKLKGEAEAQKIEALMAGKDFIVYHGNLSQTDLTKEMAAACVWLYPSNFQETFCITALEALCSGVYPVVRAWGALPDTLSGAESMGMASVLDFDCETEEEIAAYADETIAALRERRWEKVSVDPSDFSWRGVAKEWLQIFGLEEAKWQRSSSMSR